MIDFFELLNKIITFLSEKRLSQSEVEIQDQLSQFSTCTVKELKLLCRNALIGVTGTEVRKQLVVSLFQKIKKLFLFLIHPFRKGVDSLTLRHIALGVEAFKRVPADLPQGSYLYPRQVQASIALTQRCLIQMDTGEGKTYALLPTAFALACKYQRVYIVCSNEYLAWRDATRTRNYYEFVGLDVGLCISNTSIDEWSRQIIYTTLDKFIFRSLHDELSKFPSKHSITNGAVLLDEADAILIDKGYQDFSIVQSIKGEAVDWDFAIEYAKTLKEGKDIITDRIQLSAELTVLGENNLKNDLANFGTGLKYLLLRYAVETAYIAIKIVEKDIDYVIEDDHIFWIDNETGRVERNRNPNWIAVLEFTKGFPPKPKQIYIHQRSPAIFLRNFSHISGMGGTIIDDSMEYFFSFWLPTIVIPPRISRYEGKQNDLYYLTKKQAYNELAKLVDIEAIKKKRPVLVGTQTTSDAEQFYSVLKKQLSSSTIQPKLLTWKNDHEIAKIFERAGQVNSVIIATQLAGRGVDIRLSEQAIANGGLALFGIEHSNTIRHDRQFLGRAGRQGDPYTARFVISYEDHFWKNLGSEQIMTFIVKALEDNTEAVSFTILDKALNKGQKNLRKIKFQQSRNQLLVNLSELEIQNSIKKWFEYSQLFQEGHTERFNEGTSLEFLKWITEHFIINKFAPLLENKKHINTNDAEKIALILNNTLELTEKQKVLPESIKVPQDRTAIEVIHQIIHKKINNTLQRRANIKNAIDNFEKFNNHIGLYKFIVDKLKTVIEEEKRQLSNSNDQLPNQDIFNEINELIFFSQIKTPITKKVTVFLNNVLGEVDLADHIIDADLLLQDLNSVIDELKNSADQIEKSILNCITFPMNQKVIESFNKRTPKDIVHWSVHLPWIEFIEQKDKIKHKTNKETRTWLEHYRIINTRVFREWRKIEGLLSTRILRNLLRADRPYSLDDLFFLEDNEVYDDFEREKFSLDWAEKQSIGMIVFDPARNTKVLIQQFIVQSKNFNWSKIDDVKQFLLDFTQYFPLHTLQTPDQVQQVLMEWFHIQIEDGVEKTTRKLHLFWLREFLIFLKNNNYIKALPSFHHRIKYFFSTFTTNLKQIKTAFPIMQMLIFLCVYSVLTMFGNFADPKQLEGLAYYLDNLIFSGLLSRGTFTAPAIGILIISSALNYLAGKNQFLKVLFSLTTIYLLPITFAWWLTDWYYGSWTIITLLQSLFVFITICVFFYFSRSTIQTIEIQTGVTLTSAYISFNILVIFFSTIFQYFTITNFILASFLAIITFNYWWTFFNTQEISLLSVRIKNSRQLESEEVSTCLKLEGYCGAIPHIFGILFSWSLYGLFQLPSYASLFVYLFTVCIWSRLILNKRFSLLLWEQELNKKHQIFKYAQSREQMGVALEKLRKKFFQREVTVQSIIGLGMYFFFFDVSLPSTTFPLSLIIVFSSYLFGEHSKLFVIQMYHLLFTRTSVHIEILDLSEYELPEVKDHMTFLERIKLILKNRLALVLTIILVIMQIVTWLVHTFHLW